MKTFAEIKPAVVRSISHNEIVLLIVKNPEDTFQLINCLYDEVDSSVENNGDLDVWGLSSGQGFRLRVAKADCK